MVNLPLEQECEARVEVVAPPPAALHVEKRLFFNRELSWLEFNRRVLEEASDTSHPMLERLKFLSIFSTNLDEFYMIRVSGLKQQMEESLGEMSPDGMTAAEQLAAIAGCVRPLITEQMRVLNEEVLPALEMHGIRLVSYNSLDEAARARLDAYFTERVFPVLTPQAVDPSHPFPYISNRSLNLGVMIEPPADCDMESFADDCEPRFARVKVPPVVERLVPVDDEGATFTLLEEIIAANIGALFPGVHVGEPFIFRVTRDADIEIEEDEADDLLRMIEHELRQRRFGAAVRLEVERAMPDEMAAYLAASLRLTEMDVTRVDGALNVPDLMTLYSLDRPQLKDQPLAPSVPSAFQNAPTFDAIKRADVLVHHPYDSFSVVADFIRQAARDADVLAIKTTLYRTGQHSPIVQALMDASERGKQVAAIVELKARFDEENNIEWARRLEKAGVHVVYGLMGLKTHCKIALVVRREGEGLRRYVHIGTGNYNPTTARIYTDLGLFTADEATGADATELFNYLTGFSKQRDFRRLLVAPVNLRAGVEEFIRREIEHHRRGLPARIIVKINSLTDTEIIRLLYDASRAGIPVDLIVRGICMLRPGIKGLSETITVRSIVGRFLEHSRIYYFENAGREEIFIGSADWMRRNLNRRVELVTPVTDERIKRYLRTEILDTYLRDTTKARRLDSDGSYTRILPPRGEEAFDSQSYFARL